MLRLRQEDRCKLEAYMVTPSQQQQSFTQDNQVFCCWLQICVNVYVLGAELLLSFPLSCAASLIYLHYSLLWDRVLLCSTGWPEACCKDLAGFELTETCLSQPPECHRTFGLHIFWGSLWWICGLLAAIWKTCCHSSFTGCLSFPIGFFSFSLLLFSTFFLKYKVAQTLGSLLWLFFSFI